MSVKILILRRQEKTVQAGSFFAASHSVRVTQAARALWHDCCEPDEESLNRHQSAAAAAAADSVLWWRFALIERLLVPLDANIEAILMLLQLKPT